MFVFTLLIVGILAQIDDDLLRSGVKHVEKLAVLRVQASHREIVDAVQAIDQFPNEAQNAATVIMRNVNGVTCCGLIRFIIASAPPDLRIPALFCSS